MNKTKKILSLVLVTVLLLALSACNGTTTTPQNDGGGTTPVPATNTPDTPEESTPSAAGSDEVYTFSFSVADPQGSVQDEYFVMPFQKLLDEKTNGRVKLEVYYGSSLATQGTTLDGIKNGIIDMGQDVTAMYPGQYLYNELLGTPGLDFGGYENFSRIANEYSDLFYDEALDPFVVIARFSFGDFGICSAAQPIYSSSDVNGMTVRTTSQIIPWYESLNASASFLPMGEVYESLRLSVINGVHTSLSSLHTFKLAEVANYYTPLPMHCGDSVFVMSRDLYDSLPADIQAALDEVFAEMFDVGMDFVKNADRITMDSCKEMNPDFELLELEDSTGFLEAAQPLLQAKVAELNAAGLDGDGAYEWLLERSLN